MLYGRRSAHECQVPLGQTTLRQIHASRCMTKCARKGQSLAKPGTKDHDQTNQSRRH